MNKLVLFVSLSLWSAPAFADRHPPVELTLDPCVESRDEIQRIVQIELGDLLAADRDPTAVRTHAHAGCEGGVIVLRVDDPRTGQALVRSIELASAAAAVRPRLVGLALVELVASSWTELQPPSMPPPTPVAPSPPPAPHEAPPPAAPSLTHAQVAATAGAIQFSDMMPIPGVELRVTDGSRALIGWMLDAEFHRGTQDLSFGGVTTQVVDLGAAAQIHRAWNAARGEAGLGLRGGAVEMIGQAGDASLMARSFSAQWFGAFATGHIGYAVTEHITLDAMLEAGYVLSPVVGLVAGQRAAAVDGRWLAAHVGIGVRL